MMSILGYNRFKVAWLLIKVLNKSTALFFSFTSHLDSIL